MSQLYHRILNALVTGTQDEWQAIADQVPSFPDGVDDFVFRRWIINAIDVGSAQAVEWMLSHDVDLSFRDEEGYTPLHAAIDRDKPDKHMLLESLLKAGAPVNIKGVNDWTPAHMAAARDDVGSLQLLVAYGADLTIRTDIDEYATPLEQARFLGKQKAVEYLESVI